MPEPVSTTCGIDAVAREAHVIATQYEEAIARDPNTKFGWYAVRADGTKDWFADHVDGD